MALGSNHLDDTSQSVMEPNIWSSRVNDFFRAGLKAGNFFEDWSEDVAEGGDTVHRPSITEMSANSKGIGSEVTLNKNAESKVDLAIDTHNETSFVIEDAVASKIKRSYRIQKTYAQNAAYTTAATLEDALMNLFSGFSNTVGDSSTDLNDSNIRQAIAYLDAADVPEEDRAFFLHPNVVWNQLMGIDKFTLVQNTGGADPVLKGTVGTLYGIPVVQSSRLSTSSGSREGALAHKSALAYAVANPSGMSGVNKVRLQTSYLQEYLGYLVTADLIFGVIENRDTSGVYIKASS